MHTPPLDHHVPGARNRLLHLAVRALAVDNVKGRRGRHDRELAAEDDHVVCRGRPVLERWAYHAHKSAFRFSSLFCGVVRGGEWGVTRTMGLSE